jgi:hypothetical protein
MRGSDLCWWSLIQLSRTPGSSEKAASWVGVTMRALSFVCRLEIERDFIYYRLVSMLLRADTDLCEQRLDGFVVVL